MDIKHGHEHAAWTWKCSIDMSIQHGHENAAWTCCMPMSMLNVLFSLNVFGGREVPIVHILLCRPSEDSLQGSAIPDGSPSKDWQSNVGWGVWWILTQDCSITMLHVHFDAECSSPSSMDMDMQHGHGPATWTWKRSMYSTG